MEATQELLDKNMEGENEMSFDELSELVVSYLQNKDNFIIYLLIMYGPHGVSMMYMYSLLVT